MAGPAVQKIHNIVIGTAGHIDHGKTALLERLTGINADRLPEEKERGMTIDLGFARYQLRNGAKVGLIDVPGHERFIKNMVAGAFGIDLVFLVVAADDGVMPQTLEHLEIMKLLGIKHGLIVLTKIDLVNEDLRELASEEIRDAVVGTFLQDAPIVAVSSVTGEGFDELVEQLHTCVDKVEPRSTQGIFRMPIQRVFSSKGFGTVLTGVPASGQASVGDNLVVLPIDKKGRVRGIQAYFSSAPVAQAGQSSAVNLADIDYRQVKRGMTLTVPGQFRSSSLLEARFEYLKSNQRPLRHLTQVRFHCGTAEILGSVYLLEGKTMAPGESGLVQIRLQEPAIAAPGDHFVLRLHSPMVTMGGGEIIDLSRWRLKQGKAFILDKLLSKEMALGSPRQRLANLIDEHGFEALAEKDVATGSGIPPEEVKEILRQLYDEGEIFRASRPGFLVSRRRFEEAKKNARKCAEDFFGDNPRRLLMEKVTLRNAMSCHELFFQALLASLAEEDVAHSVRGEYIRWTFHHPQLSEKEKQFRDALLKAVVKAPFAPPRVEEVAQRQAMKPNVAEAIAELLLEEGELIKVGDILFHRQAIEDARERVRRHLEDVGTMTASQAKNLLGSSRKYIIPLLEMFDQEQFTIRRGDVRELRKK